MNHDAILTILVIVAIFVGLCFSDGVEERARREAEAAEAELDALTETLPCDAGHLRRP